MTISPATRTSPDTTSRETPAERTSKPRERSEVKTPEAAPVARGVATRVEDAPLRRASAEEERRTRADLETRRRADVQPSFMRARLDATLDGAKRAAPDAVPAAERAVSDAAPTADLAAPVAKLSGPIAGLTAPDAAAPLDDLDAAPAADAAPAIPDAALGDPVHLAPDGPDYTRVDDYARRLADEAGDPTYSQAGYARGVADALSGRVPGMEDLSDAERTRLLDHAHEQMYGAAEIDGNGYVGVLLQSADPAAREVITDDLAQRSFELSDRARDAGPDAIPAERDRAIARAQSYATQAAMEHLDDPAGFLDRLGPDAGRFADALHVEHGSPSLDQRTELVARELYGAADGASPVARDAFRTTLAARATGQPENPIEAEAWRRLAVTDPAALGQADLHAATDLLREDPPRDGGAAILGEDDPAVRAAAALRERQPVLEARRAEEDAIARRAGFDDDAPYTGDTPEARAEFLADAAGRVDRLSPRAADQALEALRLQREAGVAVPDAERLERDLGRRLMVATGVDLAARIDQQMDTALADQGWAGQGWDAARNVLGMESGSEAVGEKLDALRTARDQLAALQDFSGTDAELSVALAERLDGVQLAAQDASRAVGGYIESQDGLSTRGLGLLQAIGGGLEVVAGAGMIAAPEPLTSVAGVGVVAVGVDDLQAGIGRVITGEEVPTFRAQLAEQAALAAGASPETAGLIGTAADLAPAGVALARGVYRGAYRLFAGGAREAGAIAEGAPLADQFTDLMAARPRTAPGAVRGPRFAGPVADTEIAALEAQGIRVVRDADARLDAGVGAGNGPLGAFDPRTGEVFLRSDATYYEWLHESAHARQWLELGRDAYQAQTRLQREAHVYDDLMAHAGELNRPELRHARDYLQRLTDDEAHSLWVSGRYTSSREVFDALRAQGVPEDILLRVPRELFGYGPR